MIPGKCCLTPFPLFLLETLEEGVFASGFEGRWLTVRLNQTPPEFSPKAPFEDELKIATRFSKLDFVIEAAAVPKLLENDGSIETLVILSTTFEVFCPDV